MVRRLLVLLAAVLLASTAVGVTPVFGHPEPGDTDGDGVFEGPNLRGVSYDPPDNCILVRNADQRNTDGDRDGDRCDPDDDNDGIADRAGEGRLTTPLDNCRLVANPDQADRDGNGVGDVCDFDADGDTVQDGRDNCPDVANRDQLDNDRDDRGDACDPDDDDDTIPDLDDNCPTIDNFDQTDVDRDGRGTLCDPGEGLAGNGGSAGDADPATSVPRPSGPAPGGTGTGGGAGAGSAGGRSGATAKDTTAPRLTVRLPRVQRSTDLAGGMPVSARCSEACALTAELRLDARTARRLGVKRRLARADGALGGAGSTWLFVRTSARTQRTLFRRRTAEVRATMSVTVVDGAGNRATATKRLSLRR